VRAFSKIDPSLVNVLNENVGNTEWNSSRRIVVAVGD
jgi:hypothetical protein